MAPLCLTSAEARATVGTRVRTRVAFAGVPQGGIGIIIGADRVIDGDAVDVAWGGSGRRTPWVDWLTKAAYEARLMEKAIALGLEAPGRRVRRAAQAEGQPGNGGGLT
jgi:hypothetical protein